MCVCSEGSVLFHINSIVVCLQYRYLCNNMCCFLSVATVKLAEENKDFVIGFICQNKLSEDPQMLHLTPGVYIFSDHITLRSLCNIHLLQFFLAVKMTLFR